MQAVRIAALTGGLGVLGALALTRKHADAKPTPCGSLPGNSKPQSLPVLESHLAHEAAGQVDAAIRSRVLHAQTRHTASHIDAAPVAPSTSFAARHHLLATSTSYGILAFLHLITGNLPLRAVNAREQSRLYARVLGSVLGIKEENLTEEIRKRGGLLNALKSAGLFNGLGSATIFRAFYFGGAALVKDLCENALKQRRPDGQLTQQDKIIVNFVTGFVCAVALNPYEAFLGRAMVENVPLGSLFRGIWQNGGMREVLSTARRGFGWTVFREELFAPNAFEPPSTLTGRLALGVSTGVASLPAAMGATLQQVGRKSNHLDGQIVYGKPLTFRESLRVLRESLGDPKLAMRLAGSRAAFIAQTTLFFGAVSEPTRAAVRHAFNRLTSPESDPGTALSEATRFYERNRIFWVDT